MFKISETTFNFEIKQLYFECIDYINVIMSCPTDKFDFTFGFTQDEELIFMTDGHVELHFCGQMMDTHTELFEAINKWFGISVKEFIKLEKQLDEYDEEYDYTTLGA